MEGSWMSLRLNAIIIKDNGVSDGELPSTTELPSQLAPFYRVPVVTQPAPRRNAFGHPVVTPQYILLLHVQNVCTPFSPRIRRTTCVFLRVFRSLEFELWGCVRTYFQTTVSRQERIARERERERESIDFIVERDFSEIWIKNKGYFCKGSWGEECISIPSRESFNYFCIVTIFVGIIRLLF